MCTTNTAVVVPWAVGKCCTSAVVQMQHLRTELADKAAQCNELAAQHQVAQLAQTQSQNSVLLDAEILSTA